MNVCKKKKTQNNEQTLNGKDAFGECISGSHRKDGYKKTLHLPKKIKKKSLNRFPNKPWFLRVCSTCLLKTLWEKEKLLVTSNFSFSPIVFYPFGELSAIFINFEIVVCQLFQFGRI